MSMQGILNCFMSMMFLLFVILLNQCPHFLRQVIQCQKHRPRSANLRFHAVAHDVQGSLLITKHPHFAPALLKGCVQQLVVGYPTGLAQAHASPLRLQSPVPNSFTERDGSPLFFEKKNIGLLHLSQQRPLAQPPACKIGWKVLAAVGQPKCCTQPTLTAMACPPTRHIHLYKCQENATQGEFLLS